MKIVISDPKSGQSYQTDVDPAKQSALYGMKIGDVFDGGIVGALGYKLKIQGGSDKEGFPMHPKLVGTGRRRILLESGPGFRPTRKGIRKRKNVRGNTVSDAIAQLNVVVVEAGSKSLAELFPKKEKKEEQPAEKEKKKKK